MVSSSSSDHHDGVVEDHGNGTYTATVTPLASGPNELSISLHDSPLKGSPFQMKVVHGQVVGTSSHIVNEKDLNTLVAMIENVILIQATDRYSNDALFCNHPPFNPVISVDGADSIDHDATQISYVGGGKYQITLVPLKLHITLGIKINGMDIAGSPFDVAVHPGTFHASSSSATGLGIRRSRAGEETSFVIQAKDKGGNSKGEDHAFFDVFLVLTKRSPIPANANAIDEDEVIVVAGSQEFIGDGQYLSKYTCYVSGEYALYVRNDVGEGITGSPFHVTVDPADMSAPHSLIVGNGVHSGMAGELAEVRVYGRDKYGNFVNHAVETIEMVRRLSSRHQSEWEAHDFNNGAGSNIEKQLSRDTGGGVFVVDFIPKFSGKYEMNLTTYSPGGLEASHYSSPDLLPDYLVLTRLDEDVEQHWKDNSGTVKDTADTESHFGASWNGKLRADHSEEYEIVLECNNGGFSSLAIDGRYNSWQSCYPQMAMSVAMTADKAVHFSLRYKSLAESAFVILKWVSASTPLQKIPSSNLYHHVTVGNHTLHPVVAPNNAHPSQSTAVGDSLHTAISGIEHEFLVESRDEYANGVIGNLLLEGRTQVEVESFHHQDKGSLLVQPIIDNNNGTYTVRYTPVAAGIYFLFVKINGSDIKESPFLLRVEPGETDPLHTLLLVDESIVEVTEKAIQLEMQAMDVNDNKRHTGGDDIRASLITSPGEGFTETLECKPDYATNGLYSITCPAASQSGSYLLNVSIVTSSGKVQGIKSSPFEVTIYPGHATPETTEIISGSTSGHNVNFVSEAGIHQSFVVRLI